MAFLDNIIFYFKLFFLIWTNLIFGIFYSIAFLFIGKDVRNGWRYAKCFQWSRNALGIRPIFLNSEKIDSKKNYVIIINHQSFLDPFILSELWPHRCISIMKNSLRYLGTYGIVCTFAKTYFINRKHRQSSIDTLNEAGETIIKEDCSMWIFPEGTRSDGKKLLSFKKGAFHIALKAKYDLLPIVTESYLSFFDPSKKMLISATPKVHVLDPIPTEGKTVDELIEESYKVMNKCFTDNLPDKVKLELESRKEK